MILKFDEFRDLLKISREKKPPAIPIELGYPWDGGPLVDSTPYTPLYSG